MQNAIIKNCSSLADIPFEQLSQIAEQLSEHKNISITTHFKRFYPYKSFASHLLGYLTRMDMEMYGKMGLEKIFEDTLRGERGKNKKQLIHLAEIYLKLK